MPNCSSGWQGMFVSVSGGKSSSVLGNAIAVGGEYPCGFRGTNNDRMTEE